MEAIENCPTCRKGNEGFMICCNKCNLWYHGPCVGQFKNRKSEWHCPCCTNIWTGRWVRRGVTAKKMQAVTRPEILEERAASKHIRNLFHDEQVSDEAVKLEEKLLLPVKPKKKLSLGTFSQTINLNKNSFFKREPDASEWESIAGVPKSPFKVSFMTSSTILDNAARKNYQPYSKLEQRNALASSENNLEEENFELKKQLEVLRTKYEAEKTSSTTREKTLKMEIVKLQEQLEVLRRKYKAKASKQLKKHTIVVQPKSPLKSHRKKYIDDSD